MTAFDLKAYHWKAGIDYRAHPDQYKVGKGEQGVLICEPYKSEIVAHWRFKTPEIATKSSQEILVLFHEYLAKNDFVGADMARKFLQMGFTRARRYANYKGGLKYDKITAENLPKGTGDPDKIASAKIFYDVWQQAEAEPNYKDLKQQWKKDKG